MELLYSTCATAPQATANWTMGSKASYIKVPQLQIAEILHNEWTELTYLIPVDGLGMFSGMRTFSMTLQTRK